MALPTPNQSTPQYQNFAMKEALKTAFSASILQMQANQIAKSSLMKFLPGMSVLKERAEMKKRELYEKTGRDESGRKLTKQEFEEKEKRRGDLGALAEIRDIMVEWKDNGVSINDEQQTSNLFALERIDITLSGVFDLLKANFGDSFDRAGKNPDSTTINALSSQESADEKEKEDDQDQIESEGRTQGFFSKLFGKKTQEGQKKGWLSGLMELLSPLLKLFTTGGIAGLLGTIFTAIGGALTTVIATIAPLLAAMVPVLIAIAPLLIAGIIAGAGAMLIANWLNDKTEEKEKAAARGTLSEGMQKTSAKIGDEKLYKVKTKEGTKFRTAKEIKMTEDEVDALVASGEEKDGASYSNAEYVTKTKKDAKGNVASTDELASTNSPEQIAAYQASHGNRQSEEGTVENPQMDPTDATEGVTDKKLISLASDVDTRMKTFTESVKSAKAKDTMGDLATVNALATEWNLAMDSKDAMMKYAEEANLVESAKQTFGKLTAKYPAFKGLDAYATTNLMTGEDGDRAKVVEPSWTSAWSADPQMKIGGKNARFENIKRDNSTKIDTAYPTQPPVAEQSSENAALKSASTQGTAPVVANSTTVNQSNSSTVMGSITASRTGVDADKGFNGVRLSYG